MCIFYCPKDNEMTSDDGMITVMCLPPNTTAILQPMDQNIINLTKTYYKKSLLAHLVSDNSVDLDQKIGPCITGVKQALFRCNTASLPV